MKEQTRNAKVQINEEETGKLPEKEFRILIVNMIKNLENKIEKNNIFTEIKNTLEGINSRIPEAEE